MFVRKLFLINFKNYGQAELEFCEKFNCFVGNNGEGKTNLLDAIHYLSFCKSFFNPVDSQNIYFDAPFFVIQGEYQLDENTIELIYCGLKRNEKKQFKRNQKEYQRLSDHIGLIPLVMISPADSELISEGSEVRRKFIDTVISQYDKEYLDILIQYNKLLAQRNALLKDFDEHRYFDQASLDIWDMQLVPLGMQINRKRSFFIREFQPLFNKFYSFISGDAETVNLIYDSQLNFQSFETLLIENMAKDRAVLYTTCGIHKDDLLFKIGDQAIRKIGSQGQQKTYLIALKMAQFEYLKKIKNQKPLLLLDDIFDKLDENRVSKLMEMVNSDSFGQIFITDTHKHRLLGILNDLQTKFKTFDITKGAVADNESSFLGENMISIKSMNV
jgi:DNA replication and repair protein RecF